MVGRRNSPPAWTQTDLCGGFGGRGGGEGLPSQLGAWTRVVNTKGEGRPTGERGELGKFSEHLGQREMKDRARMPWKRGAIEQELFCLWLSRLERETDVIQGVGEARSVQIQDIEGDVESHRQGGAEEESAPPPRSPAKLLCHSHRSNWCLKTPVRSILHTSGSFNAWGGKESIKKGHRRSIFCTGRSPCFVTGCSGPAIAAARGPGSPVHCTSDAAGVE